MLAYILAAVSIVAVAFAAKYYFQKNAEVNKLDALIRRFEKAEAKVKPAEEAYAKSRAKLGKASPVVLGTIGVLLTAFLGLAIVTTFTTYSWLFLGLGWSQGSANLYALVPFTLVFIFAVIVKLALWPLVETALGKGEIKNLFGHIVAGLVTLVLFTGLVLQLAPLAIVRSERYISPAVTQAQEDLDGVQAQCTATPRPDCDSQISSAQSNLDAANKRLVEGKQADKLMATVVPYGELITALGPMILIEVIAFSWLPALRVRKAKKKADKLDDKIARKNHNDVPGSKEEIKVPEKESEALDLRDMDYEFL